jgi:hypothetical protein
MARKRSSASAGPIAPVGTRAGRRLVVVVAFDVVNFSALVEADEERVMKDLQASSQFDSNRDQHAEWNRTSNVPDDALPSHRKYRPTPPER